MISTRSPKIIKACLQGRMDVNMAQKLQSLDAAFENTEEANSKRPKSTIEFPYGDLDMAKDVALTIFRNSGQQCTIHQLAAYLGHDSVTSGAFRLKYTTARTFGLIEVDHEEIRITKLGREILDPNREQQARVGAFLHVPLYKTLFERYKGYPLPADIVLEQEIATLGVTFKQKDKARQAFQRSAQQAGFFGQGRNKLVLPSGVGTQFTGGNSRETIPLTPPSIAIPTPPIASSPPYDYGGGGGSNSGTLDLRDHPLVQGLFQELSRNDIVWNQAQHDEWLELAKLVLKRIHPIKQQGTDQQ